jgi:hypothetical protein
MTQAAVAGGMGIIPLQPASFAKSSRVDPFGTPWGDRRGPNKGQAALYSHDGRDG